MKTVRHTVNVPGALDPLVEELALREFKSLSGYFVALAFSHVLYGARLPISKAFAQSNWKQQQHAISEILQLRKNGWTGVTTNALLRELDAGARKALEKTSWLRHHLEEILGKNGNKTANLERRKRERRKKRKRNSAAH